MGLEDLGQDSGPRVQDPVDFVSGTAPELDGGAIFVAVSVWGVCLPVLGVQDSVAK